MKKIYYGWWIILACALINLYVGGIVFFGFTAFFAPIRDEFGWSYAQISFAVSLRGMEVGIFSPIAGFLVDRFGTKKIILWGVITVGFGFILLSVTHTLAMFYASFVLISFGASGCTSVVTQTAVANWFHRKIGLALGLMGSGIGAGGFIVLLIVRLIDLYQWRSTLIILGIGMWVLGIPLSFLIRNRPEEYGFLPDGQISNPAVQTSETRDENVEIGFKEALKMKFFLILCIAEATRQLTVHSVTFHVMPYLSSIGISRSTGGMVAGAVPIIGIVGRFGFGWLSDFIDKRRMMALTFFLIAIGVLALGHAYMGSLLVFLFLVFFPVGQAGSMVLRGAILREYFGKSSFGKMIGVIMGSGAVGGIIGPTLAGGVFDVYGSYHMIWLLLFGLCCFVSVGILRIKKVYSHQNQSPITSSCANKIS